MHDSDAKDGGPTEQCDWASLDTFIVSTHVDIQIYLCLVLFLIVLWEVVVSDAQPSARQQLRKRTTKSGV